MSKPRQVPDDVKKMTKKELLQEYRYLCDKIDGVSPGGGFGKYELIRLYEEVIPEMNRREDRDEET